MFHNDILSVNHPYKTYKTKKKLIKNVCCVFFCPTDAHKSKDVNKVDKRRNQHPVAVVADGSCRVLHDWTFPTHK